MDVHGHYIKTTVSLKIVSWQRETRVQKKKTLISQVVSNIFSWDFHLWTPGF